MGHIITAPNEKHNLSIYHSQKLFLAGGITNCPDWQSELIELIKHHDNLTIYNPRRKNFPIHNPNASEEQIVWEYRHLTTADIITFWFSRGSPNPIVLYELGRYGLSNYDKRIIIGIDPEYERKRDVEIQTSLSRKSTPIVYSLEELANMIDEYLKW